jgi:hypothetical protein
MPNPMNNMNRPRSAASLRHQTFDSHCIDVRVRGNAWQVCEKYQALARDAQGAGDRVAAENYLQHAEHYYRIIEAINEATALEQRQHPSAGGPPPSPFGEQPSTPTNFYGAPDAAATASSAVPGGNPMAPPPANQQQAAATAEVQRVPQSPNPFFTQEETDEQAANPTPLAARR